MAPHQQELKGRFRVVTYTCWRGHRGDDVGGTRQQVGDTGGAGVHWAVCHREEDSLRKRCYSGWRACGLAPFPALPGRLALNAEVWMSGRT